MHILIFEPRLSGHHAQYLKFMLQAAKSVTDHVTLVTTSRIHELPEFQVHLVDEVEGVTVLPVDESEQLGVGGLKQDYHHFQLLKSQIEKHQPDHVWVSYIDRIAQIAGMMNLVGTRLTPRGSKVQVAGLLFRGAAAYDWNTTLGTFKDKLSLKLATLAPIETLYTVDNVLYEYLQTRSVEHCRLMPEPVEAMELPAGIDLHSELDLPVSDNARYVVSLGGQNRRKGVDLLIPAFMGSKAGEHDYLVLAGKLDADIAAILEEYREHPLFSNVMVRDELLSVEQIQMYLQVADYVAVPYPEHIGSSSFVIRASVARKPLIAADSGWIGWTTRRYDLGFSCNVKEPAEFISMLDQAWAVSNTEDLPQSDFKSLAEFHTVENFKNTWLETLG